MSKTVMVGMLAVGTLIAGVGTFLADTMVQGVGCVALGAGQIVGGVLDGEESGQNRVLRGSIGCAFVLMGAGLLVA